MRERATELGLSVSEFLRVAVEKLCATKPCPACKGTGIKGVK